jgi:cytochrome c-type biogenesis protein CcmH/NrfG
LNKETILTIAIALVVGLLGGYLIFSISGQKNQVAMTGGLPVGGGAPTDYQARIAQAEKIVENEPKNLQAWIQLGNDYFDTEQHQKAINAYAKALELKPDNPNVLTDQGVMYRRIGWYDKALANFEKAQSIDPKHLQSLFNIGVVYAEDLKQPDKAIKAWTRYLELDSTSPTAQQIKRAVDEMKARPAMPGK